jgi:hypothetical protein
VSAKLGARGLYGVPGGRAAWALNELTLSAFLAAACASAVAWAAPVGADFAAHAYGRILFLRHGFLFWDNYWYAGRYSLATYSLLYYPLAALVGIRALAVVTVACAVVGFALVLQRQWGPHARWSSRAFAITWSGVVLVAVFPFALGAAFGFLALAAIQSGRRIVFSLLGALTLASSPLAFLLLLIVLGAAALASSLSPRALIAPFAAVAASLGVEAVLWLLFPASGRFPFGLMDLLASLAFAGVGVGLTVGVARARPLLWFFVLYGGVCLLSYAVPTELGSNVTRVRFAALPCALLVVALRRWRPFAISVVTVCLALAWNSSPFLRQAFTSADSPDANATYWQPAVEYLRAHISRGYRVEAVDTAMHTPALYLASAGFPLARGWFRQDDFPVNAVLYRKHLSARRYLAWLRSLGVQYVVLSTAPTDYSSRSEATLLRRGNSGLIPAYQDDHLTIFRVPRPRAIIVGPAEPQVLSFTDHRITLELTRAGRYELAVRYSPYWQVSHGCIQQLQNGMTSIRTFQAGRLVLTFAITDDALLHALTESSGTCPRPRHRVRRNGQHMLSVWPSGSFRV